MFMHKKTTDCFQEIKKPVNDIRDVKYFIVLKSEQLLEGRIYDYAPLCTSDTEEELVWGGRLCTSDADWSRSLGLQQLNRK